MSNAFEIPDEAKINKAKAATLTEQEKEIEAILTKIAWFPYRRLDWFERTCHFVRSYDKICFSLIDRNPDIPQKTIVLMKSRRCYLPGAELVAPWVKMTKKGPKINPKWSQWKKARRWADNLGMTYDDYNAGAILSAMSRGWSHWPQPNHLSGQKLLGMADGNHKATIPGFEKMLYEKRAKLCDDPWFDAAHYCDDPIQRDYYRHVARELLRIYGAGQRAERAFKNYQRDGKIASSLCFNDLIR